jgi:hypothetical protein
MSAHNQEMRPYAASRVRAAGLRFPNWTRFITSAGDFDLSFTVRVGNCLMNKEKSRFEAACGMRGKSPGTQVQHTLGIRAMDMEFRRFFGVKLRNDMTSTKSARGFAPIAHPPANPCYTNGPIR